MDDNTKSWPAVVVVVFAFVWVVVGVRGLVKDDSRFAWGMFPYTLETTIEDVRFLDKDGALVRTWRPPRKPGLPKFLRPGEPHTYGYAAGGFLDLVEHHLLPRAARDAPKKAATVSAKVTLVRSERPPVTTVISIPVPPKSPSSSPPKSPPSSSSSSPSKAPASLGTLLRDRAKKP